MKTMTREQVLTIYKVGQELLCLQSISLISSFVEVSIGEIFIIQKIDKIPVNSSILFSVIRKNTNTEHCIWDHNIINSFTFNTKASRILYSDEV